MSEGTLVCIAILSFAVSFAVTYIGTMILLSWWLDRRARKRRRWA